MVSAKKWAVPFFLSALYSILFLSILSAGELKTFSKVLTVSEAEYVVEVGGTLDPENVGITVENLGQSAVESPRITVNSEYDWYDVNSMVREITEGCTTDEEKALALWQWVHWKRFQRSPQHESSLNPVKGLNGYG